MFETAPSTPSVSQSLLLALTDSSYASGPKWEVERALDRADLAGVEGEISGALARLEAASTPAPSRWFGQRLPILWTQFMAARGADGRALTVWMAETARLLGDLPHDIVALAIDDAIKSSRHGFLPSVGEIRTIADPLALERSQHVNRLAAMMGALGDPVASDARASRRRENAAHRAHMAAMERKPA